MPGDPAREVGYQRERKKERELLLEKVNKSIQAIDIAMKELVEIRHRLDYSRGLKEEKNAD